jgi:hypothetical protein
MLHWCSVRLRNYSKGLTNANNGRGERQEGSNSTANRYGMKDVYRLQKAQQGHEKGSLPATLHR